MIGARVQDSMVSKWKGADGQRVIHQAELLPILVSTVSWAEYLRDRLVLIFIDNDAALASLIKGNSANEENGRIVHTVWQAMAREGISPWFCRVPATSDPSDDPSRGAFARLRREGYGDDSSLALKCFPTALTRVEEREVGAKSSS